MRLDWLVPAREASVLNDGTIDVRGGGVDTLVVEGLGSGLELGVVLAMRVCGEAREWGTPHTIAVTHEAAARHRIVFVQHLTVQEASLLEPSRDVGVLLAAPCRWTATEPGVTQFVVRLDDEVVASLPIAVVEDTVVGFQATGDPSRRMD